MIRLCLSVTDNILTGRSREAEFLATPVDQVSAVAFSVVVWVLEKKILCVTKQASENHSIVNYLVMYHIYNESNERKSGDNLLFEFVLPPWYRLKAVCFIN